MDECINSEKMNYAREMLMGKCAARDDIPCTGCKVFWRKKETGTWFTEKDMKKTDLGNRKFVMIVNKLFKYKLINRMAGGLLAVRLWLKTKTAT